MSYGGEFAISAADSLRFARLSGDYNPMHIDALAARRMPYGGTVVHGIHLLLKALDGAAIAWSHPGRALGDISVTFSNPVHTDETVAISAVLEPDAARLRLAGKVEGRTVFSASLEVRTADEPESAPPDREFPASAPVLSSFPPAVADGAVPLALSVGLVHQLLPAVAAGAAPRWIADLLASTRIVGMQCPGMDSVYSVCRLRRRTSQPLAADSMQYRVVRADERFRMIRLDVEGGIFEGHLEAFYRARPVEQPSLAKIAAAVPAGSFAGQRALVVGGSRGLGEIAAKIVAAGGGEVIITYARGRAEAEQTCDEARALGFACSARQLDLNGIEHAAQLPRWLREVRPSHVYFFASPRITRSPDRGFSNSLYQGYAAIYLQAFGALAEVLLSQHAPDDRPIRLLYPSSVFLDTGEPGFAEYCAAKAAGEALCAQLAARYAARASCPRLPRMRTDQTSAVRDKEMQDSLPVMLALLRDLQG